MTAIVEFQAKQTNFFVENEKISTKTSLDIYYSAPLNLQTPYVSHLKLLIFDSS